MFRIVKICSLAALLGLAITGCGGTEKGKYKDSDRPIATEPK